MPQHSVSIPKIKQLEAQLIGTLTEEQQLAALDRLVGHYIYTDIGKASQHIQQMQSLAEKLQLAEHQLNYHWYAGQLDNQLYHFDSSLRHYQAAQSIAEEIGDIDQQVEILVDSLGTYINLGDWEKTQLLIREVEKNLSQFPNAKITPRLYCRMAFLNLHLGNMTESLESFKEAERIYDHLDQTFKLKDYYFLTLVQAGIGNIHQLTGDSSTSIKSYLKVVDICETLGMNTRLSWHYLNVGNGYLALNDHQKARQYFLEAIKIKDDLSKKARAGAFANLGFIAFADNDYLEALRTL